MTKPGNIRTKSYFTQSVNEGIAHAREELGDDALLLNTRRLERDAKQPGGYEVVFAIVETKGPTLVPAKQARPAAEEDILAIAMDRPSAPLHYAAQGIQWRA